MIILKNRKAALKRIKIKKKFFERKKAYKAHLCATKNSNRLRNLSSLTKISINDFSNYKQLIPYKIY